MFCCVMHTVRYTECKQFIILDRFSLRGSGEPLPGGGAPPAHVQPAGAGRSTASQAGKQGNVNNMKIGMTINLKMLTSGNAEPAIGGVESDAGGSRRRCRRSLSRRSRQEAGAASAAAAAHAHPRPAAAEAPTSGVASPATAAGDGGAECGRHSGRAQGMSDLTTG